MKKCTECPKYAVCNVLCSSAELYVRQDEVRGKEILIGLPRYQDVEILLSSNTYLTKTEREILTLLGRGLTRGDICQVLEISRGVLRWHIYNIKKKS